MVELAVAVQVTGAAYNAIKGAVEKGKRSAGYDRCIRQILRCKGFGQ